MSSQHNRDPIKPIKNMLSFDDLKNWTPDLTGASSLAWEAHVRAGAKRYKVEDLIFEGKEILHEPHWSEYGLPESPVNISDTSMSLKIQHYNKAHFEWREQQPKVRLAYAVLILSIDLDATEEICNQPTPRDAFNHIKAQFAKPNVQTLSGTQTRNATSELSDGNFEAKVFNANLPTLADDNLHEWQQHFLAMAAKHDLKGIIEGQEHVLQPPVREDYPSPAWLDLPQFTQLSREHRKALAAMNYGAALQRYEHQSTKVKKANILIQRTVPDELGMKIRCFFPNPSNAYRYLIGELKL